MLRKAPAAIRRVSLTLLLFFGSAAFLPAGENRWTPIGPEGGSVLALAAGPGVVYAGTALGGVFKSVDGGSSWTAINNGLTSGYVDHLTIDPSNGAVVYAVAGDVLFKTIDGGATWSKVSLESYVFALAIAPSAPGTLYAAGPEAVFKTTDGGATWTALPAGPRFLHTLAIDPVDPARVYGGGLGGLFRTVDGGAAWTASTIGPEAPAGSPEFILALAVDPRQPSTVYAGLLSGELFKSTDHSASWRPARPEPGFPGNFSTVAIDSASGAVYAVFDDALGEGDGIYKSTDGGTTWTGVLPGLEIRALAFDAQSPGRLYAGTHGLGFHRSEDGGISWVQSNRGLRATFVLEAAADPHAPGTLFTGGEGLAKSTDGGATWTTLLEAPPIRHLLLDPSQPGVLYIAFGYNLLKSLDGGSTWQRLSRGMRSIEFMIALAMAPSDSTVLYAVGWGTIPACNGPCPPQVLYRSTDGGESWTRVRAGLGGERGGLISLTVDPANPSTVYAGGTTVFKSTDGGRRWKAGRGLRGPALQILVDPFAPEALYAVVLFPRGEGLIRGIDKSVDGGATWKPLVGGLPGWIGVNSLTADPATRGLLYAATDRGVFVTRDGGASWKPMNDGLNASTVFTVALDPRDPRTLYAGTIGGGGLFTFTRTVP